MTDEERDTRLVNVILELLEAVRELRDGVRELNARIAVQDARESQVPET